MSKPRELSDEEIVNISEQSGVEVDVIRSWYKGNFIKKISFLFILLVFSSENFY